MEGKDMGGHCKTDQKKKTDGWQDLLQCSELNLNFFSPPP